MARDIVKKIILTSSISLLMACGSSKVMTRQEFYTIDTGTSAQQVVEKYGKPYSIKNRKDGSQEYLYIERIPAANQDTAEQNNYILVVKNGQVVSKRTTTELPSAYDEIYDEDPNDVPN